MSIIEKVIIHIIAITLVIMIFTVILISSGSFFKAINPNVEVYVDQKIIYKGSDFCVNLSSTGFATTVKTRKFFCILPDKSYTSKDVVVRTVE